jgi:ankyrin repeat protein
MESTVCCTTLSVASGKKHTQCIIKLLTQRGFVFEHRKTTALHHAIVRNQPEELIRLLHDEDQMCHVNTKDFNGFTPLHYAVRKNSLDLILILLDNGADIGISNDYGQTPLDIAPPGIRAFIQNYDEFASSEAF